MEIWLDSCDYQVVKEASQLGILRGVTTNPQLIAQAHDPFERIIKTLLDIQDGPVAAQVSEDTAEKMIAEGLALHALSDRVLVKVPVTQTGIVAIKMLKEKGVFVLATVIFHAHQALLAAIAGADYVAPYVGRMFAAGIDAYSAIQSMQTIFRQYQLKTKIMAASLKSSEHILSAAEMGIAAVTLKPSLFSAFIADDPLTLDALQAFEAVRK